MTLKVLATAAFAAAMGVGLGGCQTVFGRAGDPVAVLKQLGETYAHCARHVTYSAGVGVLAPGAQISGSIDCAPVAGGEEVGPLRDVAPTP